MDIRTPGRVGVRPRTRATAHTATPWRRPHRMPCSIRGITVMALAAIVVAWIVLSRRETRPGGLKRSEDIISGSSSTLAAMNATQLVSWRLQDFARDFAARMWVRYNSTNCFRGFGATSANASATTIARNDWGADGGASACARQCALQPDCTAVVVGVAKGRAAQRSGGVVGCFFLASIAIKQCKRDGRFYTLRAPVNGPAAVWNSAVKGDWDLLVSSARRRDLVRLLRRLGRTNGRDGATVRRDHWLRSLPASQRGPSSSRGAAAAPWPAARTPRATLLAEVWAASAEQRHGAFMRQAREAHSYESLARATPQSTLVEVTRHLLQTEEESLPFARYPHALLLDYIMAAAHVGACPPKQLEKGRARVAAISHGAPSSSRSSVEGLGLGPGGHKRQLHDASSCSGRSTCGAACGSIERFNNSRLPYRWLPGLPVASAPPRHVLASAARLEVMHMHDGWDGPLWLYAAPGSGVWWDPGRRLVRRNLIDALLTLLPVGRVVSHLESLAVPPAHVHVDAEGRISYAANTSLALPWPHNSPQLFELLRWRAAFRGDDTWVSILRKAAAGAEGYAYLAMAGVLFSDLLTPALARAHGIDSIILTDQMHVWPRDHRAWLRPLSRLSFHKMLSSWPARLVWPCGPTDQLEELASHIRWVPEIIEFRAVGATVGVGTWEERPWQEQLVRYLSADADGAHDCPINPSNAKALCTSCSEHGHVLCECAVLDVKQGHSLVGTSFDVERAHRCCARQHAQPPPRPSRDPVTHVLALAEASDKYTLRHQISTRHIADAIRRRYSDAIIPPRAPERREAPVDKAKLVSLLLNRTAHRRLHRFWKAASDGDWQALAPARLAGGEGGQHHFSPHQQHAAKATPPELAHLLAARFAQLAARTPQPSLGQPPPQVSETVVRQYLATATDQESCRPDNSRVLSHRGTRTTRIRTRTRRWQEAAQVEAAGTETSRRTWMEHLNTNCFRGFGATSANASATTIARNDWGADGGASACARQCARLPDCTAVVVAAAHRLVALRSGVVDCFFLADVVIDQCKRDTRFRMLRALGPRPSYDRASSLSQRGGPTPSKRASDVPSTADDAIRICTPRRQVWQVVRRAAMQGVANKLLVLRHSTLADALIDSMHADGMLCHHAGQYYCDRVPRPLR